ncbi:unnamed protein product [Prunus armeniaca]|uniref:RNase H type-1 domain-containing protein n=1 Tax=Prunus armeniaca TaxID=36596 RepID=A0A6J5WW35_PRUAR|nr:unnamed protein product [Prunus armeniaca]
MDGAFRAAGGLSGFGLVARDHNGSFLGCKMGRFHGVSSPLHAELLALREGLRFTAKWPDICICLESDAQGMINTVLSRGVDLSPLGCLIEDFQELLHAAGRVSVVHGFHEVNGVADRLAHYALSSHVSDAEVKWWDSPPVWLSDTLIYDSS